MTASQRNKDLKQLNLRASTCSAKTIMSTARIIYPMKRLKNIKNKEQMLISRLGRGVLILRYRPKNWRWKKLKTARGKKSSTCSRSTLLGMKHLARSFRKNWTSTMIWTWSRILKPSKMIRNWSSWQGWKSMAFNLWIWKWKISILPSTTGPFQRTN